MLAHAEPPATLEQFLDECREAWNRATERVKKVKVS
jgi:hypothetical protein